MDSEEFIQVEGRSQIASEFSKILLPLLEDLETPSKLFQEIHSNFDARKEDKRDEAITSPYNTRFSSHQQPKPTALNLGDNWSDSTPAFVDHSNSASQSNLGAMTIPGNYHNIIPLYKPSTNAFLLDRPRERVFLTHTTLTTIVEELENVKTDLWVLVSWEGTKINDFRGQAEVLHGFYTHILRDPLSGSSMPAICSGLEALEALDLGERQMSLFLRAQHSCIMLTNYTA